MRGSHQQYRTTCSKGVQQEAEKADPQSCADALNMWAPNGRVRTRPGYVGVGHIYTGFTLSTNPVLVSEDVSTSTFTTVTQGASNVLVLDSFEVGDNWYIGADSITDMVGSFNLTMNYTNTNTLYATGSYWNGAEWKTLPVTETLGFSVNVTATVPHLSDSTARFMFVTPKDWATTTVDSNTKYFIRLTLVGDQGETALDSQVEVYNGTLGFRQISHEPTDSNSRGIFAVQGASTKRYLQVSHYGTSTSIAYTNADAITLVGAERLTVTGQPGPFYPATAAVVPQFDEAYVAYGDLITRHDLTSPDEDAIAAVETDPLLVGPARTDVDVVYSKDYVGLRTDFPAASQIIFHKGRLWALGGASHPFSVKWSEPNQYRKIWPLINDEELSEDDNSAIVTGASLGEHLVVFKQDSIWVMVESGLNRLNLQTYVPKKVVSGVGCVAANSVKQTRGQLVFLSEDGVYSFDGRKATKLSDDLDPLMKKVSATRRPYASAVNWKRESVYLLSFSTTGDVPHDKTVVFDYKNGGWWIWDNIDAQFWMRDEDASDNEKIYFGDSNGAIYEFGKGQTDHGAAITSTLTTQRFGYGETMKKLGRRIEVWASAKTRSLTCDILANDEEASPQGAGSMDFTHSDYEKDWTDTLTALPAVNQGSEPEALDTTVTVTAGDAALLSVGDVVQFDGYNDGDGAQSEDNGGSGYTLTDITGTTVTFTPGLVNALIPTIENGSQWQNSIVEIDGTASSSVNSWAAPARRARRMDTRRANDWAQVKLTHNTENQPAEIALITLGSAQLGNR